MSHEYYRQQVIDAAKAWGNSDGIVANLDALIHLRGCLASLAVIEAQLPDPQTVEVFVVESVDSHGLAKSWDKDGGTRGCILAWDNKSDADEFVDLYNSCVEGQSRVVPALLVYPAVHGQKEEAK